MPHSQILTQVTASAITGFCQHRKTSQNHLAKSQRTHPRKKLSIYQCVSSYMGKRNADWCWSSSWGNYGHTGDNSQALKKADALSSGKFGRKGCERTEIPTHANKSFIRLSFSVNSCVEIRSQSVFENRASCGNLLRKQLILKSVFFSSKNGIPVAIHRYGSRWIWNCEWDLSKCPIQRC